VYKTYMSGNHLTELV